MRRALSLIAAIAIVTTTCTGSASVDTTPQPTGVITNAPTTTSPTLSTPTTAPDTTATTPALAAGASNSSGLPGDLPLVTAAWGTDWSRTTIPLQELKIGIFSSDPRDIIAPIDHPKFESVAAGAEWLGEREPGIMARYEGGARFYPLAILTQHEIVNDQLADIPVAVTYCPLCNTGVIFDRRINGTTHRFGVSGLLRKSDLVMWDDLTHSLWQQITGEGIVGAHAGINLTFVPSSIVAFSEFAESFPNGEVMSTDTGFDRRYGLNPYESYSSRPRPYGFFEGEIDGRFPALERVIGVTIDGFEKAFPFSLISAEGVINDVISGTEVVIFWGGDTADALDGSSIAASQAIGTGVAYSRTVNGEVLTFVSVADSIYRDEQTASLWNILGVAIDGPLSGKMLDPVFHRNEFWFAWAAFFPDGDVYEA